MSWWGGLLKVVGGVGTTILGAGTALGGAIAIVITHGAATGPGLMAIAKGVVLIGTGIALIVHGVNDIKDDLAHEHPQDHADHHDASSVDRVDDDETIVKHPIDLHHDVSMIEGGG